jgi:hypothetical protein
VNIFDEGKKSYELRCYGKGITTDSPTHFLDLLKFEKFCSSSLMLNIQELEWKISSIIVASA